MEYYHHSHDEEQNVTLMFKVKSQGYCASALKAQYLANSWSNGFDINMCLTKSKLGNKCDPDL